VVPNLNLQLSFEMRLKTILVFLTLFQNSYATVEALFTSGFETYFIKLPCNYLLH